MNFIQNIKDKLSTYKPVDYKLSYDYFINVEQRLFYEENGYVVVKDIVSEEAIQVILDAFNELKEYEAYYEVDGFITSANYGYEIQNQLHKKLSLVNEIILPKLFYDNKIYKNLLNILVLKFCKEKKELFAHQDAPLVDETEAPTTCLWIPTVNINTQNGALMVLPKSHKYFRWQRIHDQEDSPLSNLKEQMLDYMIPLYINKGDLIIFDNSLIHASAPNLTNEIRVAMTTTVAPNNYKLVHYCKSENNRKIKKYYIDESFWKEGCYMNPSLIPEKYHAPIIEEYRYQGKISKSNFINIISKN